MTEGIKTSHKIKYYLLSLRFFFALFPKFFVALNKYLLRFQFALHFCAAASAAIENKNQKSKISSDNNNSNK